MGNKMNIVLDENIIERAAICESISDARCGTLIGRILEKCDKLYCDNKLYKSYYRKLKKYEKKGAADHVSILINLLWSKGSIDINNDSPSLSEEHFIPTDDIFLIRLAVHTNSILVSNDNRLISALNKSNFLSRYNIVIKYPNDVYPQ